MNVNYIFDKYKIYFFTLILTLFIASLFIHKTVPRDLQKEKRLASLQNKYMENISSKKLNPFSKINSLEKYLKDLNILIISSKQEKSFLNIKFEASFDDLFYVLSFIEKEKSAFKIKELKVNKLVEANKVKENRVLANIKLKISTKLLTYEKFAFKPLEKKLTKEKSQKKEPKLKKSDDKLKMISLQGVIENKALVSNKWLSIGDKIYDYKIVYIGKNFIKLKKSFKIYKVSM